MNTVLIKTRKFNKEVYKFYACTPSYAGETGILGLELQPYVLCKTPENCFGYEDTVLYDSLHRFAYTTERHLTPWILREVEKELEKLHYKVYNEYFDELERKAST